MLNKTILIKELEAILERKINMLNKAITGAKESRASDTKSSAGDKFETGRSMMQMEIAKNEGLLNQTKLLKHNLHKINVNSKHTKAAPGSLVTTNFGTYFLSIPLGKVELQGESIVCISIASPLGQVLNHKNVNDQLNFLGKSYVIKAII